MKPRRSLALPRATVAWIVGLFAPAYLGAVLISHRFHVSPDSVSILWLASGVYVGTLIVSPLRLWPMVVGLAVFGDVVAIRLDAADSPNAFVDATASIEALVGAALVRFVVGAAPNMARLKDVILLLILAAGVGPAIAAFLGAGRFVGDHPSVPYWSAWQVWWFAHGLGVLAVTPAMLVWREEKRGPPLGTTRRVELVLALGALAATTWLVLGDEPGPARSMLDFPFLLFPVLLWIAFRFDRRIVTASALLVSIAAVWLTAQGLGPFHFIDGDDAHPRLLAIQFFLGTLVLSVLLIRTSLAERWRAERARRDLQVELDESQRLEAVGRIAGRVGHDFNNDLSVIQGWAEALAARDADPAVRGAAEEISTAALRAGALAKKLLVLEPRGEERASAAPVADLLRDAERMLYPIVSKRFGLTTRFASEGVLRIDRNQFQRVLLNLVMNAREAMPDGGVLEIRADDIDVSEEFAAEHTDLRAGPHVRIQVSDTGIGIAPDTLAHVFEPFFTTKEAEGGTGLGLASAYAIARQLGGTIVAESELGLGSTFSVYLPLALATPAGSSVER